MAHDAMTDEQKETPQDEELLAEWRVHLLTENPRKSAAALALLIVALVLVHLAFRSEWLTVLGGLILVGSLSDWLFPITYRLTTQGASYRNGVFRKRMAWADVRRTSVSDVAVKLSPFAHRSRLESFRALILRFADSGAGTPGHCDEVIRIVKERAHCGREGEND